MKAAVYCGTRNLYQDMIVAAKSLAHNSSVDVIYFLIEDPVFPYELPDYIKPINVSEQKFFGKNCPNVYKLWTWMVLMRAAFPKVFSNQNEILSLDVDTIVDKNIDELWDLDLTNYYLAGVPEPGKSKQNAPYVNNGVALYNLKKFRDDHMDDEIIRALNNNKYAFAEQDCINFFCSKRIYQLPSMYNANDYTEICKDPKIVHFACNKEYNKTPLFNKYKEMPWDKVRKPKPRFMIHSAPSRMWYVDDFLIPSMVEQGISKDDIINWCDINGKGNLHSCMDGFRWCGDNPTEGGTWHLQDDIVISRDFYKKTKEFNDGVVCGFCVKEWGPDAAKFGVVPVEELWYSFQCIRIPDKLAGDCARWFYNQASIRPQSKYRVRIQARKHDDDFFRFYLLETHANMKIRNLYPNIVNHIDYMIGGTLINAGRPREVNGAVYWEDESILVDLRNRINAYKHQR